MSVNSDISPYETILEWLKDAAMHYDECVDDKIDDFVSKMTHLIDMVDDKITELKDQGTTG